MMGRQKNTQGKLFYTFDLEEVVTPDHLVRQIEASRVAAWAS